jgi:hypothetical protein
MLNKVMSRLTQIVTVLIIGGIGGTGSVPQVESRELNELNDFKEVLQQALIRQYPSIAKRKFEKDTPLVEQVMSFVLDTELNMFKSRLIKMLKTMDFCITNTLKSGQRTSNRCISVVRSIGGFAGVYVRRDSSDEEEEIRQRGSRVYLNETDDEGWGLETDDEGWEVV